MNELEKHLSMVPWDSISAFDAKLLRLYFDGLTHQEIADKLGKPKAMTSARIDRIKKRLGITYDRRVNRVRGTHCRSGHPLTGENLYVTPDGKRKCKECQRVSRVRRIIKSVRNEVR